MLAVLGDNIFLVTVVQIDIELGGAGFLQMLQFCNVLLGLTQHTEAFNDFRRDEIQVGVIALAVLGVVVA
jgi:hypothetical protein